MITCMGCLANDEDDVAPIEVKISTTIYLLSVYQRGSWYDYYNCIDSYLFRVMECVTPVIDLIYEGMHIVLDERPNWFGSVL